MRHRSREFALPRLLEIAPPRPSVRVPVRKVAKRTGILAYKAAVLVVMLLVGFAIARRVLPHDTCCGDPPAAVSGVP